ncbi:MAG: IS110 family transposase, partial [Waterburya sp.]
METIKNCCGLDVHKDIIFAAIYKSGKSTEVREFSTLTIGIESLSQWLKEEGVDRVAMESTSIYWVPIWNILESSNFNLMLVNPFLIKQMPGRKSDVKDAQWIAQLLSKDLLRGSVVPNKHIRSLRCYSREYVKRQYSITRVIQSIDRILVTANIRISNLVSRIESKTVLSLVEKIVEGEFRPEELLKCVHGSIKNRKGSLVKRSLEGMILSEHQFVLRQRMEEYELLQRQSEELDVEMTKLCNQYFKEEYELLQTMPGVSHKSAMQIIAETGTDMSVFETSNKMSKWAGLCPRNDE